MMNRPGCFTLILFLLLLALLPLAFGQLFATALLKLRINPTVALWLVVMILLGSGVNIPIKRIVREESMVVDPLAVFGLVGFWPQLQRLQQETVIAVNVGGCLIPTGIALYELMTLLSDDWTLLMAIAAISGANIVACYWLARPIPHIGIALPGLIPPAIAAVGAIFLAPEHAPPLAFVAGVLGPLIGADLLHLSDIAKLHTGIASIGGAGTFDGIVLSGIVAAYLS